MNFYSDPTHPRQLVPEPLTAEAFEAFGDVISIAGHAAELINEGRTEKFGQLAFVDAAADGGRAAMHIYRSQPVSLPLTVEVMERHPLASQAFMPLHDRQFLVIVAEPGEVLESAAVRAFLTNGKQGINLHRGTWHHYQVSLQEVSEYLVIDRVGAGNNFEERRLAPALVIESLGETWGHETWGQSQGTE